MGIFTTQIVLLLSLLFFAHGSMGNALVGTSHMRRQGGVTVANIYNVKVSYVRKSNTLELDLDLEAVMPDVVETYVGLSLFIDGQDYSWEKDGGSSCIIDPSICPLPLYKMAHVHVSGNPEFTIPDDVWSRPDPIGTFTFSITASDQAYGEVPGTLTHVNFVPGGTLGASGQSPGAAWISGLVTVGLLTAAGLGSLLGLGNVALPAVASVGGGAAAATGAPSAALPAVTGGGGAAAALGAPGMASANLSGAGEAAIAVIVAAGGAHGIVAGKASSPDGNPASSLNSHPASSPNNNPASNPNSNPVHATNADGAETGHNASAPNAHAAGGGGGGSEPPLSHMDPIMLFLQFQFISTTGLLSLNYPPLYRGFTVNFAWANFILPIRGFKNGAARVRKCDFVGSSGIALYADELGIDPQDVFLIAWFTFLCICAILLGLYLFIHLFLQVKVLAAGDNKEVWVERQRRWGQMTSNNSLRLMTLALGSLTTFIFYQWTQACIAGSTTFASVFALFVIIASLSIVSLLILRKARSPEGLQQLYDKQSTPARRWSSLYCTLRETKINFFVLYLLAALVRRAIVGFIQKSGLAQNILLIIFESAMCIVLFMYKPYYSQGYNRLNYLLAGMNILSLCLSLPFNFLIKLTPESAWALAIVHIVLHSLVVFALAVLTVIKLGWGVLWYRSKHIAFQSTKPARPKFWKRKTASSEATAESEKAQLEG